MTPKVVPWSSVHTAVKYGPMSCAGSPAVPPSSSMRARTGANASTLKYSVADGSTAVPNAAASSKTPTRSTVSK